MLISFPDLFKKALLYEVKPQNCSARYLKTMSQNREGVMPETVSSHKKEHHSYTNSHRRTKENQILEARESVTELYMVFVFI